MWKSCEGLQVRLLLSMILSISLLSRSFVFLLAVCPINLSSLVYLFCSTWVLVFLVAQGVLSILHIVHISKSLSFIPSYFVCVKCVTPMCESCPCVCFECLRFTLFLQFLSHPDSCDTTAIMLWLHFPGSWRCLLIWCWSCLFRCSMRESRCSWLLILSLFSQY